MSIPYSSLYACHSTQMVYIRRSDKPKGYNLGWTGNNSNQRNCWVLFTQSGTSYNFTSAIFNGSIWRSSLPTRSPKKGTEVLKRLHFRWMPKACRHIKINTRMSRVWQSPKMRLCHPGTPAIMTNIVPAGHNSSVIQRSPGHCRIQRASLWTERAPPPYESSGGSLGCAAWSWATTSRICVTCNEDETHFLFRMSIISPYSVLMYSIFENIHPNKNLFTFIMMTRNVSARQLYIYRAMYIHKEFNA